MWIFLKRSVNTIKSLNNITKNFLNNLLHVFWGICGSPNTMYQFCWNKPSAIICSCILRLNHRSSSMWHAMWRICYLIQVCPCTFPRDILHWKWHLTVPHTVINMIHSFVESKCLNPSLTIFFISGRGKTIDWRTRQWMQSSSIGTCYLQCEQYQITYPWNFKYVGISVILRANVALKRTHSTILNFSF